MKTASRFSKPASARTPTRCAVLVPIIFGFIAFAAATEAKAQVKQYQNNVFTNQGQSDVKGFADKLAKAADALKSVTGLDVYVGYHADIDGQWCINFDSAEKGDVVNMAQSFPNANLIWLNAALPDSDIKKAVAKGNVLFTWCDSDTKVKSLMGKSMPPFEKEFK